MLEEIGLESYRKLARFNFKERQMNPNDDSDFDNYILKVKHSLSDRLPWPLSARIQSIAHQKLIEKHGKTWTVEQTAKLLNKEKHHIRTSIKLGEMIKTYPDIAKITNKRRAWRIVRLYRNVNPDLMKLKIAQEIQTRLYLEKRQTYHNLNVNEITI